MESNPPPVRRQIEQPPDRYWSFNDLEKLWGRWEAVFKANPFPGDPTTGFMAWLGEKTDGYASLKLDDERLILTSEEIKSLPPPEWLVEPYLMKDSLACLYGPPGSHKSFLALHWAKTLGQRQHVLYVVGEGVAGMGQRLAAWDTLHEVGEDAAMFVNRPVNLALADDVLWLENAAEMYRPSLVVVDTLARNSAGAEENSARDMGQVVASMDRIRRASGACVLAVHHTGKDATKGGRGSSALRAAWDTELSLSAGTLRVEKQKDAEEAKPRSVPVREVDVLIQGQVRTSLVVVEPSELSFQELAASLPDSRRDVLDAIEEFGPITFTDLLGVTEGSLSKRTLQRAIQDLKELALIEHVDSKYQVKGHA